MLFRSVPWQGQFVSLVRMKDWLQLLGFEPSAGRLACYIPPTDSAVWHQRWSFLESAGDRWWGVGGGVYMLEAIKRVQGMRLIAPAWTDQRIKERKFAAVARYERTHTTLQLPVVTRRPGHSGHLHLVK